MELRRWLEDRTEVIATRWAAEVTLREGRRGDENEVLRNKFLRELVSFLPACLGERRGTGEDVWQAATHLYGSLALRRGLAAGEVVEELQLLRGVILRLLLETPPSTTGQPTLSRDLLTLNRVLDLGVVQSSVAYVDDLFFAHLQGSGIPEAVTAEVVEEVRRALVGFHRELAKADPRKGDSDDSG